MTDATKVWTIENDDNGNETTLSSKNVWKTKKKIYLLFLCVSIIL